MSEDAWDAGERQAQASPVWESALDELERSLLEASRAVLMLRRALTKGALPPFGGQRPPPNGEPSYAPPPAPSPPPRPAPPPAPAEATQEPVTLGSLARASAGAEAAAAEAQAEGEPAQELPPGQHGSTAFNRLWDRIETERSGQQDDADRPASPDLRGLDLLPQQYLMTVEDREGKVDLVTLHRALAGLEGMQEISLVSYANGVPVVAMRSVGAIDLDQLGEAVALAMDRQCEVIPQDNGKLYLRMKANEG